MMTEQQIVDFIKAYEPVESPHSDVDNHVYNARRIGNMAKEKYGLSECAAANFRMLYLMRLALVGQTEPLKKYGVEIGGRL